MKYWKVGLLSGVLGLASCANNSEITLHGNSKRQDAWDFGPVNQLHARYRIPGEDERLRLTSKASTRVFTTIPSRDAATRDGIEAKEIELEVENYHEDSHLVLLLDAGAEDRLTTRVSLNNVAVEQPWSSFRSPPEARKKSKNNIYFAVVNLQARDTNQKVSIKNSGGARLLAAHIFSRSEFRKSVDALEGITPEFSLQKDYFGSVSEALLKKTQGNAASEFLAATMTRAEDFTQKMGWEWATDVTGLNIFDRYHQVVQLWDGIIALLPEESAWHDRVRFERARVMVWLWAEQGGEPEFERYRSDIQHLLAKYPKSKRIRMYAGEDIPNPPSDELYIDIKAPLWSQNQLRIVHELRTIAHWWINERQAENGELGGKLGDDVELMRWWPILTSLDDKTTIRGWEKLAAEVWRSKKVKNGYSSRPIDVEHASEYIADTAPMMAYFSEADWLTQLQYNTENFRRWTARDQDGDVFFRSAWFSWREVDETPPKNRDLDMNARAMKPLRFLALLQNDPTAKEQVVAWARAWAKLAMRQDKGKPLGVFPASYRVSDSQLNGDQDNWYSADMFWHYFEWEYSPGTKLYQHLLVAYLLSGDDRLLEPMEWALKMVAEHGNPEREFAPGTPGWASNILMRKKSFWKSASEWRFLTRDHRFDKLLLQNTEGYARYRLDKDEAQLNQSMQPLLHGVTHNRPLQQEEVLFTDRVFLGKNRTGGYPNVLAMLTGDVSAGQSPLGHVTWLQPPKGFTALVLSESASSVNSRIFIHAQENQAKHHRVGLRVWRLPMGNVTAQLTSNGQILETTQVQLRQRGQVLWFDLSVGEHYRLHLTTQ